MPKYALVENENGLALESLTPYGEVPRACWLE